MVGGRTNRLYDFCQVQLTVFRQIASTLTVRGSGKSAVFSGKSFRGKCGRGKEEYCWENVGSVGVEERAVEYGTAQHRS